MKRLATAVPSRVVLRLALLGMMLGACRVTVNDLEKWRNRRGSEAKFVEWMLDPDVTPDVRAKAIEMLFEQFNYEGAANLPRVGDLPAERRDRAISDALPRIRELFEGAEFSLGGDSVATLRPAQVRDGTIMLLNTTENPEVRASIADEILLPWLREHYRPCITSTGRHPNSRVLSMVGADRGLPVVSSYIVESTLDDVICQNSYLPDVTWVGDVGEELATAYTERWNANAPEDFETQRQFVLAMLTVPQSQILKNWFFEVLIETDSPLAPDVVDALLDYVAPMTDATDAERYAAMIQGFDGFLRWIGFENVLRLRGAAGIELALGAIPDSGVWGRWGGEVVDDGLLRAANWICDRPPIRDGGDEARLAFEAQLENSNLVARAIALQCLGNIGVAETVQLLEPSSQLRVEIPSWGAENNTVGALAGEVIERIESRQ